QGPAPQRADCQGRGQGRSNRRREALRLDDRRLSAGGASSAEPGTIALQAAGGAVSPAGGAAGQRVQQDRRVVQELWPDRQRKRLCAKATAKRAAQKAWRAAGNE